MRMAGMHETADFGPDEWADRYTAGDTTWDLGRAHPELMRRLADLGEPGTVLVPGAGRGHDASAFAGAGWQVIAADFAPTVEPDLQRAVGQQGRVVIGDVFEIESITRGVDLVFDHTFFCAIPLRRRPDFGVLARAMVRPWGRVASIVYPVGRPGSEGGPPYAMSVDDLANVLGEGFELEADEPAAAAGRSWETRWACFRREDGAAG